MESNYRYYQRRACEERQAADRAITAAARERHRDLAMIFASKAEQRAQQPLQAAT